MTTDPRTVATPRQVAALPNGSVIESTQGCMWPARYAGRRWQKCGDVVHALDRDSICGDRPTVMIAFFKDPLPARVVSDD